MQTLERLKKVLDPILSPILRVTREDVVNSRDLRQKIMDENLHLMTNTQYVQREPGNYLNPDIAMRIGAAASFGQSDIYKQAKRRDEFTKHNLKIRGEFEYGEEGIDWNGRDPMDKDPRKPDIEKFTKDVKSQLKAMQVDRPELAAYYQEKFFGYNPELDGFKGTEEEVMDAVRYYPGSAKGPLPEDDPEHYSEWFMRNQPNDLIYGKDVMPDYKDIGVKWKWVFNKSMLDDEAERVENKDDVANFVEKEEQYSMEKYVGQPEFEIADRDSYDTQQPGKLPMLRFYSHLSRDEMLPLPDAHTMDYSKVHDELERWTLFTSLPNMLKQ